LNRVNDFKEWKAVEIHVTSAHAANSVLANQYRSMRIMNNIPGKLRKFSNDLCGDIRVLLCGNKDA